MDKAPVGNKDIADRIGLTESGVSRLRTGGRRPSLSTMEAIDQAYGWPVMEQWKVANYGSDSEWVEKFERHLTKDYERRKEEDRQRRAAVPPLTPGQAPPPPYHAGYSHNPYTS